MEVVIIGGGIIGLSLAFELINRGVSVKIVEKDRIGRGASWVAGGMLAPQSEGLEEGVFLDFCLESRSMYPSFVKSVEEKTNVDTGYWECGILKLAFNKEELEQIKKDVDRFKSLGLKAQFLTKKEIKSVYPSIGDEVLGGALYEEDAQVDNRKLCEALAKFSYENAKVFENAKVEKIESKNGKFFKVKTEAGDIFGDVCVVCAGAWSGQLSDLPVYPLKGEMLAVDVEKQDINRVLYSSRAYLIPRKDYHRLVVGATQEDVGFKEGNTVYGTCWLLKGAMDTLKNLKDKNIQELWYGYRPATPDELPILGEGKTKNLIFATGHHRNGILLAPITAKVIADYILKEEKSKYIDAFSYDRFSV